MKEHQGEFAIEKMCRVFEVSRSGFYAWLTRKPSKKALENQAFKRFRLGSPKLTSELRDRSMFVSRPRVARLMKQLGIPSTICKKFRIATTDSNHEHQPFENLLNRNFTTSKPGEKWVSDIT